MSDDNELRQYVFGEGLHHFHFYSVGHDSDPCRPQHVWKFNLQQTLVNMAQALKDQQKENQELQKKQDQLTHTIQVLTHRLEAQEKDSVHGT